jgi:iron complex outermembrane recepter protein
MGSATRFSSVSGQHGVIGRLVSLVLASAVAGPTFAQTAPAAPERAGPELGEIIVTATRHEESLSKVPLSVTALNQESLDLRGVKDFQDVAKFTPGVNVDNSGTNNISIRGIASTGGAGTTGIYIDDTPIQMRALAFNPDEALPKAFDIDRVEVLRGPQGTLFGAGSEGGTVRFITNQPSLTKTSGYARAEVSYTEGGSASYEAGIAGGAPVIDGKLGVRASVWYRRDGGWIDRVNPVDQSLVEKNGNYDTTKLVRLAAIWAPSDNWTVAPSIYYQDRYRNDVENYWPIYSDTRSNRYVSGNPTQRNAPDKFYLPALKIEGDLGSVKLISNTSYYHRDNTTGYDGTLYDLGFYQTFLGGAKPLLDGSGLHLPAGSENFRVPASVDNNQRNFTQEIRLASNDTSSKLIWTTGLFYSQNKQDYLEQLHNPQAGLDRLIQNYLGDPTQSYGNFFTYCPVAPLADGSCPTDYVPVPYDSRFPNDSYFLQTHAKDEQLAWFGEGTYAFTDQWKLTVGARYSKTKFTFDTLTGGPELFLTPQTGSGDQSENSFTPKVSIAYQYDPRNLYYATYSKGFRPGGANNPVPAAACGVDFANFRIKEAPPTFNSDTVNSFEIGAKNNWNNRIKVSSSIYYIKWNNIQQTVVPPICQISFISNLGEAVAKGGDVQVEWAVTDAITTQISAGYTSARYTKDSRLTPFETTPIVASGDAITGQSGQPGAPVTASIGVEYRFTIADRESFVRIDDEYQGKAKWSSPGQDPATQQYDSANYTVSSTNFASLRTGMGFGRMQFALFIDNLLDTKTITNYNWTIDPGTTFDPNGTSRLQRQYGFRPRTFGLSFTYR